MHNGAKGMDPAAPLLLTPCGRGWVESADLGPLLSFSGDLSSGPAYFILAPHDGRLNAGARYPSGHDSSPWFRCQSTDLAVTRKRRDRKKVDIVMMT